MPPRVQPKGYMSSGLITANTLVKSTSGRLGGIMIIASATNDTVSVVLYDTSAASAAGTELVKISLPAAEVSDFKNVPLPDLVFKLGCYLNMSNGNYIVHFS